MEKNKEKIKSEWGKKFPKRDDSSNLDVLFAKEGFDLGVSEALLGLLENEKFDNNAAEAVLSLLNDGFHSKKILILFSELGDNCFYCPEVWDINDFVMLLSSAGKGISQLFKQQHFTVGYPLPNFFALIYKISKKDKENGTRAFEGLKRLLGNKHFTYWPANAITYMLKDGNCFNGIVNNFILLLDRIGKYENNKMSENLLLALESGKLEAKDFKGHLSDDYFELDIFADCLIAKNFSSEEFVKKYDDEKKARYPNIDGSDNSDPQNILLE